MKWKKKVNEMEDNKRKNDRINERNKQREWVKENKRKNDRNKEREWVNERIMLWGKE